MQPKILPVFLIHLSKQITSSYKLLNETRNYTAKPDTKPSFKITDSILYFAKLHICVV